VNAAESSLCRAHIRVLDVEIRVALARTRRCLGQHRPDCHRHMAGEQKGIANDQAKPSSTCSSWKIAQRHGRRENLG
jgi:hypothetical protein